VGIDELEAELCFGASGGRQLTRVVFGTGQTRAQRVAFADRLS